MKKLRGSQQKLLKVFHLIFAGLWLSCVIVITILPLFSNKIDGGDELYMYNYVYYVIDMFILTPAAIITLATGLIYSIFTRWGFLRHGWIIYKWIVTLTLVLTGTFYLGPMVENVLEISNTQRIGALQDPYYVRGTLIGLWAGVINSTLLVCAVVFSTYKPWKNIRK